MLQMEWMKGRVEASCRSKFGKFDIRYGLSLGECYCAGSVHG